MFLTHLFSLPFSRFREKKTSAQTRETPPCCPGCRFQKTRPRQQLARSPVSQSAYATGGCRGGAKTREKRQRQTDQQETPVRSGNAQKGEENRNTAQQPEMEEKRGERRGGKVDKMRVSSSGTKASERNIRRQRRKRPPAPLPLPWLPHFGRNSAFEVNPGTELKADAIGAHGAQASRRRGATMQAPRVSLPFAHQKR